MFAEPSSRLEQELIDRIRPQQGRIEGVDERVLAKAFHQGCDSSSRILVNPLQLVAECARARIARARDRELRVQCRRRGRQAGSGFGIGARAVADSAVDRILREQLEVTRIARVLGAPKRHFKGKQPALPVWFERHGVGVCLSRRAVKRRAGLAAPRLRPAPAIERAQHRAAPVPESWWRRLATEIGPEYNFTGTHEIAYRARLHRFG